MNRSHIIPVYVCSAYRDMQAERAYLHAQVFPGLVARFAKQGYHLEIIDPCCLHREEEAEGIHTLAERLSTIERCRPFFLGLYGTRDNRIIEQVPLEVGRRYPELRHYVRSSRLQLETVHGVLRSPREAWGSFFYCRGTAWLDNLGAQERRLWLPGDPMERHRLGAFKKALRATGRPLREYECSLDATRKRLLVPSQLGAWVQADLLRVLDQLPRRGFQPMSRARSVVVNKPLRAARPEALRVLAAPAEAAQVVLPPASAPVPVSAEESGRKLRPRTGWNPVRGYRLVEFLGRGGFGEVWKAVGPEGAPVALKFVPLDHPSAHVELRAVRMMKKVRHPQLLSMIGAWRVSGYLIIAMELAERSLMDRFDEARGQGLPGIPAAELLGFMRQAARGIDFLNEPRHAAATGTKVGIQHKDINPHNLLLVSGQAKIADFGLAKFLAQTMISASGTMTPAYAAPEFFKGHATRWSDQYSLAVSYCLLRGGRLPFEGRMARVMAGHLRERPDLFGLPACERPIVARALAKDPARRWKSCREFVEALANAKAAPKVSANRPVSRGKGLLLAASLLVTLATALVGLPRLLAGGQ
ncbi:MAG: protein kinase [Gemmataceae bacterium]